MVSCQWSRGFEWRARALGITLGKAAELAEEGGCKLIRLAARRTAERTAIRPLAWKKDEGERLRARATTRTHDPIARHAQRRPDAGKPAHCPAADVVEELELRQSMCEVFSGSVMCDHSDL